MPATSPVRDQTMDEILASIHKMILEGDDPAAPARSPEPGADGEDADDVAEVADGVAADLDIDADFIAAGVAAILESAREAPAAAAPEEKALRAERGFVDGFSAGAEDVALVDATRNKVENKMSEQQRAAAVASAPAATNRPAAPQPAVRAVGAEGAEERLVSEASSQSVAQSFDQLSRTILSQNPRTLEDLVRDMMRPMVRSWLDQNLPRIAERLVKQEIERISRGDR